MIEVNAYICPNCKDKIYSRARHDFRRCTCGEIFVDGGLDYTRVGYKDKCPKTVKLKINTTKKELYDDWNHNLNKFGMVKK